MSEELLFVFGIILAVGTIGYLLIGAEVQRPPAPSEKIDALAIAISRAENSPASWNNPGDLTISFGYPTTGIGNTAGVLIFASPADGWNALYAQLQAIVDGRSRYTLSTSLADFGLGYSGNDPSWAVNVANILGVGTDATLGDLLT